MQHRRQLAYGMLILWGFVLSINVLFRHAHRLPDGRIVSHVHPFKWTGEKGPAPYNPHTSSELSWLDAHSNTPFLGEYAEAFAFREAESPRDTVVSHYHFFFSPHRIDPECPRGPPALIG